MLCDSLKIFTLTILVATPGLAQDGGAPTGLRPIGAAEEDWLPTVNSSGALVVAVRALPVASAANKASTALVPARFAGQTLCYSMLGDNGRYYGSQTLEVLQDWTGGTTAVPVNTRYIESPKVLAGLSPDLSFGYLMLGACNTEVGNRVTLVSNWGQALVGDPKSLQIFIDDDDNRRLKARAMPGLPLVDCRRSVGKSAIYKFVCDVPVPPEASGDLEMEILRYDTDMDADGNPVETRRRSIFLDVALK
ncbi:hypothetical protein [Tropicibacter sp. S64]|uniref:hypothetical protein n=1 Tax=Tropicibacter sp. S64 TaxID=3415122 RepID=UPI003C7A5088